MNNMVNWFTKKRILGISIVGTIGFLILAPKKTIYTIYDTGCFLCVDIAQYAILFFMIGITIIVPVFILFSNKKQHIFEFWKKTFLIYLLIYFLVIIFVPWSYGDGLLPIEKDLIAFWFSVLYLSFSLVLITYQSFRKNLTSLK